MSEARLTRDEALAEILRLARAHGLGAADVEALLATTPDAPDAQDTGAASVTRSAAGNELQAGMLGRVLAWLGGIFVFAGLGVFIALNWETMNTAARIIISLGSGVAAFIMALVSMTDERYRRASTPLFLIAAALQPTGILVAIDEFSTGGNWRHAVLITTAIMVVQQGTVFWRYRLGTLLFSTIAFALWFYGTALDLLGMDWEIIALVLGCSAVGLCIGLEKTPHAGVTPLWYLVGAAGAYAGLFGLVENTSAELLFLLAACGGLFLSVYVRRRTMLVVSTIAILGFVSYYTGRHFLDSLGWPLMLVMLGVVLLLLSAMALRINTRYIKDS